jgi:hypothetical protein
VRNCGQRKNTSSCVEDAERMRLANVHKNIRCQDRFSPDVFGFVFSQTSWVNKMPFAQLVIGPPGSGKSTYCDGMQQFMAAIERPCAVVNLDPANEQTSYPAALDVRDLVTLDEIMEAEDLGPNGGVLYALEELEHNFEWLEEGLKGLNGALSRCN